MVKAEKAPGFKIGQLVEDIQKSDRFGKVVAKYRHMKQTFYVVDLGHTRGFFNEAKDAFISAVVYHESNIKLHLRWKMTLCKTCGHKAGHHDCLTSNPVKWKCTVKGCKCTADPRK